MSFETLIRCRVASSCVRTRRLPQRWFLAVLAWACTAEPTEQSSSGAFGPSKERWQEMGAWRIVGCRHLIFDTVPRCYRDPQQPADAPWTNPVRLWIPAQRYTLLDARLDDTSLTDVETGDAQRFDITRPGRLSITNTHKRERLQIEIIAGTQPKLPIPRRSDAGKVDSLMVARAWLYHGVPRPDSAPWLTDELRLVGVRGARAQFQMHRLPHEAGIARGLEFYLLSRLGRLAEAYESAWRPFPAPIVSYDLELALLYNRIAAARDVGALTDAVDALRAAGPALDAVGDGPMQILIRLLVLGVLPRLGDTDATNEIVDVLESRLPAASRDLRATALVDLGWAAYLREESCIQRRCGPSRLLASRAYTERALAEMGAEHRSRDTALINLALAAQLEGDRTTVDDILPKLSKARRHALLAPWVVLLESAQIDGDSEALKVALGKVSNLADRASEPEIQWRAHMQRSRLAERLGHADVAEDALMKAEAVGRQWLGSLDVGAATVGLRRHLNAASDGLVRLLISQGRIREAFERARAARRTELAQWLLAADRQRWPQGQRQRWHTALIELRSVLSGPPAKVADALRRFRRATADLIGPLAEEVMPGNPPPRVGRMMVIVAGNELVAFMQVGAAVTAHRLPLDLLEQGPDRVLQRAIDGFAEKLSSLDELWVIESEVIRGAALAALMHTDSRRPLFSTHELVLALDLPRRQERPPTGEVLVVTDTRRVKGAMAAQGQLVAAVRKARSGAVALRAPNSVTELVERLPKVDWFHFLGHGRVRGSAWQSGVQLPNGEWLKSAELLALPASPSYAVLFACHSAGASDPDFDRPIGIAHALLVAGAQEVLASRALLSAADALTLQRTLYEEAGPLRHRWTAALRRLHRTKPEVTRLPVAVFIR